MFFMSHRVASISAGLGVILAVALAALTAPAADAGAQAVGGITRDANGKIVPTGAPAEPAPAGDGRGIYPGQILAPAIEPNRTEYAEKARRRQNEVARIMAEERVAKARGATTDGQGLTTREQLLTLELSREDREIRAHELAHFYMGRPYTAEPEYWFVTGPLGKRYAVAGHVRFDLTPLAGDPAATLKKYEVLRRAARAPAVPSAYDLKVANELDRSIAKIREQISEAR
jgi:hypothetical protein